MGDANTTMSSELDRTGHRFKHAPFRDSRTQIRLLRLPPGRKDDDIEIELTTWDLANAPEYHAMSYTWGEDVRCIVFINGLAFWVRHNCHYALMQARLHHPNTYIWLDSICIDQDVDREKSHQVSIMKDIYVKASRVLACIGPHADWSELIVDLVHHIMRTEHPPTMAMWAVGERPTVDQWKHWLSALSSWSEDSLEDLRQALRVFTVRPYWERLWIVQDAEGQVQIHLGKDNLNWEAFHLILQLTGHNQGNDTGVDRGYRGMPPILWEDNDQIHVNLPNIKNVGNARLGSWTLEEALERTKYCNCSDPRDKVFATLSLVKWQQRPIVPDYAMSKAQVALEAIRHCRTLLSVYWLARGPLIGSSDSGILALRQALQRSDDDDEDVDHEGDNDDHEDGDGDDIGDEHVQLSRPWVLSARLSVGPSGDLTACVRKGYGFLGCAATNFELCSAIRQVQMLAKAAPKALLVNAGLAGFLCADAKPGDFIVQLWGEGNEPLLVVREDSSGGCKVIGQGCLLTGYDIVKSKLA